MRYLRILAFGVALLFGLAAVPVSASGPAPPRAPTPCLAPVLSDRCERWSYLKERGYAEAVVVGADGTAYTAATSWNAEATSSHFLVTALAEDGAEVWSRTFTGTEQGYSEVTDLALADDGSRVCVAGWVGAGSGWIPSGYAVGVACYDPGTGATLWQEILPAPEGRWRGASSIAIATVPFEEDEEIVPRDVVFVTGTDEAAPSHRPLGPS